MLFCECCCSRGARKGAIVAVVKWARAVICESKVGLQDWVGVGRVICESKVGLQGWEWVDRLPESWA